MARDKAYWARRAIQREREAYLEGSRLTAKLFREYERAAASIQEAVSAFYGKYAGKHGLTYEQAVKALSRREAQAWRADLGEYVAQINAQADPQIRSALVARLDALSANASISRLEALQGQMDLIMNDLHDKGVSQLREKFGDLFQEGYYRKMYDLQSRAGWLSEFAKAEPGLVESAVNYPWSGAMFSDRLWRNKEALVFSLRECVTQGLIQGKGLAAVSKELSAKLGQSFKAAERVVRTETNHLHNEADKAAYRAAGVEEYEFMATLDARTCAECGALDGKHFMLSEAEPGVNFPPMHPNDRCTTVEYDPEEAADWAKSGERMQENMTYEEWAERQTVLQTAPEGGKPLAGNSDVEDARRAFKDRLVKSDGVKDNIEVLQYYAETTEFKEDQTLPHAFAYDPGEDKVLFNSKHPAFKHLDLEVAVAHELSHRADLLLYRAGEGEMLREAVKRCRNKLMGDAGFIADWFSTGGKYEDDMMISDIISAITEGKAKVPYGHRASYWKQTGAIEREIFADISAIDALGLPGKNEFDGALKELYEAFLKAVGGRE